MAWVYVHVPSMVLTHAADCFDCFAADFLTFDRLVSHTLPRRVIPVYTWQALTINTVVIVSRSLSR